MEYAFNMVQKAIVKAVELHKGQFRKGDGKMPYIVHAIEVGFIVTRYTNNTDLIAAAILHDTVEDCGYKLSDLENDFGGEVKNLVSCLSEDKSIKDWTERKKENLQRLKGNQDASFIKSADALSNVNSLVTAIKEEGPAIWSRFNSTKDQQLEYYRTILRETEDFLPKKHIEELVSALKDLEYSEFIAKKSGVGYDLKG
jgi:GTP diphosphokinase / guanosine-3',5'-bis(diphosphate) 3'-diphosphatase